MHHLDQKTAVQIVKEYETKASTGCIGPVMINFVKAEQKQVTKRKGGLSSKKK